MLGDGEIPAALSGKHGEVTAVTGAVSRGLVRQLVSLSLDAVDRACQLDRPGKPTEELPLPW